jgi:RNA polymerase sigma-70 factor (ECF subfamily)
MGTTQNGQLLFQPQWVSKRPRQRDGDRTRESLVRGAAKASAGTAEAQSVRGGKEWEAVRRALEGERDALAELFVPHRMTLYRSALAILHNKEDAEDALQDALLSAYVNLGSFQGRSRFSTWLTRIVVNASLMTRRRLRARPQLSLDVFADGERRVSDTGPVDNIPYPEEAFREVENRRVMPGAMNRLSSRLRLALYLRDKQLVSIEEAAMREGTTINAMRSRALRARRRLRMLLKVKDINF